MFREMGFKRAMNVKERERASERRVRRSQIEHFDCYWNNLHTDSLSARAGSITARAAIQMHAHL